MSNVVELSKKIDLQKKSEEINNLIKKEIAPHLFMFAYFTPFDTSGLSDDAYFFAELQNLYRFCHDSNYLCSEIIKNENDNKFGFIGDEEKKLYNEIRKTENIRHCFVHNNNIDLGGSCWNIRKYNETICDYPHFSEEKANEWLLKTKLSIVNSFNTFVCHCAQNKNDLIEVFEEILIDCYCSDRTILFDWIRQYDYNIVDDNKKDYTPLSYSECENFIVFYRSKNKKLFDKVTELNEEADESKEFVTERFFSKFLKEILKRTIADAREESNFSMLPGILFEKAFTVFKMNSELKIYLEDIKAMKNTRKHQDEVKKQKSSAASNESKDYTAAQIAGYISENLPGAYYDNVPLNQSSDEIDFSDCLKQDRNGINPSYENTEVQVSPGVYRSTANADYRLNQRRPGSKIVDFKPKSEPYYKKNISGELTEIYINGKVGEYDARILYGKDILNFGEKEIENCGGKNYIISKIVSVSHTIRAAVVKEELDKENNTVKYTLSLFNVYDSLFDLMKECGPEETPQQQRAEEPEHNAPDLKGKKVDVTIDPPGGKKGFFVFGGKEYKVTIINMKNSKKLKNIARCEIITKEENSVYTARIINQ